ncbi:hypothetical protein VPZ60_004259 [Salmonella enterica]|nr:hypothetical protein [Salmonella enterica]
MQARIPLTIKAARMRLSRHLKKILQILITTRADAPAQNGIEKFTIIDKNKEIVTTSAELTPLLRKYGLMKEWEYIIGEEKEDAR